MRGHREGVQVLWVTSSSRESRVGRRLRDLLRDGGKLMKAQAKFFEKNPRQLLRIFFGPHTVLAKRVRGSIKGPISVPVSPSYAPECYPCREVPLNYNRSLLFHGGDTGSTPVRDANFLSTFAISTDIKQMKSFLMDLSVNGCGHSAKLSLVESYVSWLEKRHVTAVLRR